ncbi:MAG TPA: hypothetical protein VG826_20745 [Pirellulales bacterium]|nr:hypothetical protein [Pirellulales bacterium]
MGPAAARAKAIDHLTTLVADCDSALGATDIWQDYSPRDRAKSLALFRETREVATRLLENLKNGEPAARADWQRVMPHEAAWNEVLKAIFADHD